MTYIEIDLESNSIISWLLDQRVRIKEYTEWDAAKKLEEPNLFQVLTNKWKYENFHSDILCYLLNKTEGEKGQVYLTTFIDLLNSYSTAERPIHIKLEHYQKANADREKGRIDVGITSNSKHAIIIENKINDAIDQDRQLQRYSDYCKKSKHEIDAIVYLTRNGNKLPDLSDLLPDEKREIEKLLIPMAAYREGDDKSLALGWIQTCVQELDHRKSTEAYYIFPSYFNLLKKIANPIINFKKMDEIVSSLLNQELVEIAVRFREVLTPNNLSYYFANRVLETNRKRGEKLGFKGLLFNEAPDYCASFPLDINDEVFLVEVYVSEIRAWVKVFPQKPAPHNESLLLILESHLLARNFPYTLNSTKDRFDSRVFELKTNGELNLLFEEVEKMLNFLAEVKASLEAN